MTSITRRLFLRHTAAAGAVGATIVAPAVAEEVLRPAKSPREQALWHIQELDRLVAEDGGRRTIIIVQSTYSSNNDFGQMGINIRGRFTDDGRIFRRDDAT